MAYVTVHGGGHREPYCDLDDSQPGPHGQRTAKYVARAIARALMEQCESAYHEARRLFHHRKDAETSRMHDDALRAYEDAKALYARHETEE